MRRINITSVILAGIVGGMAFMFMEMVSEGIVGLIFGVWEYEVFKETFHYLPSGIFFHLMSFVILFCDFFLIMWLYAMLRPRFTSRVKAAMATSAFMLFLLLLFLMNLTNMGIFPFKGTLLSLAFNLVELPVAVLAGSFLIKEPPKQKEEA